MKTFVRMVWEERESVDTEEWQRHSQKFANEEEADAWWAKRLEERPIGTVRGWAITQAYERRERKPDAQ